MTQTLEDKTEEIDSKVEEDRYSRLVNAGRYGDSPTMWVVVEYDPNRGYRRSKISSVHKNFLIEERYNLKGEKILPET